MMTKAPGIEDIFPDRIQRWNHITGTARSVFSRYNYREIIVPIMEFTEVFSRGLGDETDIVSKEMFTFEDRGGRSLTLRPEGTASVVRAYCENGEYNRLSSCKFFYIGPMFRAEKPQRGRLRQFNQFGAELFGSDDPYYDSEIISMMNDIAKQSGIERYTLLINSIGCAECRPAYISKLKEYYTANKTRLCEDCQRRLEKNPLRLLDCKNEQCKSLKDDSPKISEFLCTPCRDHYTAVKGHLSSLSISFTEDTYLVRGLDYYTRTTFEFITDALGGQNAFAAGGRYNRLVETFGGKPTPAVGFAAGIERMMLITESVPVADQRIDMFIIHTGEPARTKAFSLLALMRSSGFSADIDPSSVGMKSQMKKAEREKARFAVIIGDDELAGAYYTVKNMDSGIQEKIPFDALASHIAV